MSHAALVQAYTESFEAGRQAYVSGLPITANPGDECFWPSWNRGWRKAKEEDTCAAPDPETRV